MLIIISSAFISLMATPSNSAGDTLATQPVLRYAKMHYDLNQRWYEPADTLHAHDNPHKNVEKQVTVCKGDIDIPVFSFPQDSTDNINVGVEHSVHCKTETKLPTMPDQKPLLIEKVISVFVQYNKTDAFQNNEITKHYFAILDTNNVTMRSPGYAEFSTQDMNLKSVDLFLRSEQNFFIDQIDGVDSRGQDESHYFLKLRILDDGSAPEVN